MSRALLSSLILVAALASPALADGGGEALLRGNYWRDRNTRVIAPEATLRKELPSGTIIEAGYLLDAITSASVSAGVTADQPFTELRNEIGLRVGQRVGRVTITGQYRYSTESDYWSHTGGLSVGVDLLEKNLILTGSYVYTRSDAARRANALGYVTPAQPEDGTLFATGLDSHFAIVGATYVLAPWALIDGSYEIGVLDGYQANPYRKVKVSGSPAAEVVPDLRVRHSLTAGLRLAKRYPTGVVRYFAGYAKYRFYTDSWGVVAHAPELRGFLGLGPVSMRLTLRYYTQSAADFYRSKPEAVSVEGKMVTTDVAEYDVGVPFDHCPGDKKQCFTGDSKLSPFSSLFLELRLESTLKFLARPSVPLGAWLGRGVFGVSAGRYWNENFADEAHRNFAWVQFGDAWVAGVDFAFPL